MQAEQAIPTESDVVNHAILIEAEKELAAFVGAVKEMFGLEQERQAIEDWMQELESMGLNEQEANLDFRHISVAAAARLADRVCLLSRTGSIEPCLNRT